MKRAISTIIFLSFVVSVWAVKPYFKIGQSQMSVHDLTTEVTRLLLGHDFEILGIYHPNNEANLCVIVFTCDQMTSMATSANDKGAFGAAMKIGLIGNDGNTELTMLNPHYIKHAYFKQSTNSFEALQMTAVADSLVKNALNPLMSDSAYFGEDVPKEDLWDYHFMPTMARYEDVIELNEYDEYLEAVATIKSNLLKKLEGCELVYELSLDDKEITVMGVAFHGKNNTDEALLNLMGRRCVSSLPTEILVQGNKAYILNGRYRIPLFKTDLSKYKLLKIFDIASDVKSCLKEVAQWKTNSNK